MELSIKSGSLSIIPTSIDPAFGSIESLIGFAARQNEKRGFLFVSKVLGKHIPVKPSVMRSTYDLVASKIDASESNALFIGMAETATGLGAGVADSYSKMNRSIRVIYQHTTRHHIEAEETLRISEDHSHAVSHILYEPFESLRPAYDAAKHLVVVDDEISTGNTLLNLIKESIKNIHEFNAITVVSLVSWLDKEKRNRFLKSMSEFCEVNNLNFPTIKFVSLFEGEFEFSPHDTFRAKLPTDVDKAICHKPCLDTIGRRGFMMPMRLDVFDIEKIEGIMNKTEKSGIAIIGTGEHLFLPFLMAEELEIRGRDVVFQSTTRSPVLVDGTTIASACEIPIERGNKTFRHYIYNRSNTRMNFVIVENEDNAIDYQNIGVAV